MTAWGAESPGHSSSQLAPVAHDIEQLPVQWIVQDEFAAQLTLPLAPTVRSHVALAAQLTLHDLPQVPVHVLPSVQASVQLSPEQPELPRSHEVWAGQLHDVPLQLGGGAELLPQPIANRTRKAR